MQDPRSLQLITERVVFTGHHSGWHVVGKVEDARCYATSKRRVHSDAKIRSTRSLVAIYNVLFRLAILG